jgi:hypothetical protein
VSGPWREVSGTYGSGDLVSLDLITALKGAGPAERTATVQSTSQSKGTIPETVRSNLRKASKMTVGTRAKGQLLNC